MLTLTTGNPNMPSNALRFSRTGAGISCGYKTRSGDLWHALSYDADPDWIRLRESGGKVYCEGTTVDGQSWTEYRNFDTPFDPSGLAVWLEANRESVPSSDQIIRFDDIGGRPPNLQ